MGHGGACTEVDGERCCRSCRFRGAISHNPIHNNTRNLQCIRDRVRGEGDSKEATGDESLLQDQLHIALHCVHLGKDGVKARSAP